MADVLFVVKQDCFMGDVFALANQPHKTVISLGGSNYNYNILTRTPLEGGVHGGSHGFI